MLCSIHIYNDGFSKKTEKWSLISIIIINQKKAKKMFYYF